MLDSSKMASVSKMLENTERRLTMLVGAPVKVWFMFFDGTVDSEFILNVVSSCYSVDKSELSSESKYTNLVFARYHCFYLLHNLLKMTKTEISHIFNKHHSSVIHGIKEYENLIETHRPFIEKANQIERTIKQLSDEKDTI